MHEETPGRIDRLLGRLYLILCLALLLITLIHLLPPDRRQTARLRLLRLCGRVTSRLALRTGAASMDRELATGHQDYAVPYWLSTARDAINDAYRRQS